jgi:uracil DNA glycosylase
MGPSQAPPLFQPIGLSFFQQNLDALPSSGCCVFGGIDADIAFWVLAVVTLVKYAEGGIVLLYC